MDDILKEALALKARAEAQAIKHIGDLSKSLDNIDPGLSKKLRDGVKKGDKSVLDGIHAKIEKYKKAQDVKEAEKRSKESKSKD